MFLLTYFSFWNVAPAYWTCPSPHGAFMTRLAKSTSRWWTSRETSSCTWVAARRGPTPRSPRPSNSDASCSQTSLAMSSRFSILSAWDRQIVSVFQIFVSRALHFKSNFITMQTIVLKITSYAPQYITRPCLAYSCESPGPVLIPFNASNVIFITVYQLVINFPPRLFVLFRPCAASGRQPVPWLFALHQRVRAEPRARRGRGTEGAADGGRERARGWGEATHAPRDGRNPQSENVRIVDKIFVFVVKNQSKNAL